MVFDWTVNHGLSWFILLNHGQSIRDDLLGLHRIFNWDNAGNTLDGGEIHHSSSSMFLDMYNR